MPGGGSVYRGEVASRALKAVGARAMTVDRSIIVSEDFDPARPEDQALYAHEQYHVEHSGGEGGHSVRDAEEVAARATEAMVFHRAKEEGASFTPPLPAEATPTTGPGAPASSGSKTASEAAVADQAAACSLGSRSQIYALDIFFEPFEISLSRNFKVACLPVILRKGFNGGRI